MTIDEIKKELPQVKVKLQDGTVVSGRVNGRKLPFAMVSIPTGKFITGNYYMAWEFSWKAVERAVNTDTALII